MQAQELNIESENSGKPFGDWLWMIMIAKWTSIFNKCSDFNPITPKTFRVFLKSHGNAFSVKIAEIENNDSISYYSG